mmetsp:Transcript_26625/g.57244  ORF Transcript_26625/g.57244 Transcript_26625/m.57244 type:complete len:902 (+) Transcript_26625:177-2882(+)
MTHTILIGKNRRITLDELSILSRGDAKLEMQATGDDNDETATEDNVMDDASVAAALKNLSLNTNNGGSRDLLSAGATVASLALLSLTLAQGRVVRGDCANQLSSALVNLVNTIVSQDDTNGKNKTSLMEEAASGLTSDTAANPSDSGVAGAGPPTMADMNHNGVFSIDDDTDDEDAGPPSVFTNTSLPTNASAHLWTSKTGKDLSLDEEKLGFITGDDGGSPTTASAGGGGGGAGGRSVTWNSNRLNRKAINHDHDESRELILMASRRLSREVTPQAGNMGNNARGSSFHIDNGEEDDGGDDFQQQRSSRYIKLPTCCMIHRRAICSTLLIATLLILLIAVMEPARKNAPSSSSSGAASPWANYEPLHPPPMSDYTLSTTTIQQRYNRIKDRILEHGISHASSLETTYSPQYKALLWIARDDPRQLDLSPRDDEGVGMTGVDVDEERLLFERYALAVLWFQTNDLAIVRESMTSENYVEDVFDLPFDPLNLVQGDIQWNSNTNWMSEKGLCLWHGITCHPKQGSNNGGNGETTKFDGDFYVAILNLTQNNVFGVVPREVYTGFTRLKALDLSKNELEGTVGREVGLLEDLEDLFLFDNNFSGELPNDIGKLGNLYNLYINDNKFRGMIPSEMGDMAKLRGASMFNNTFEGRIPDSLGNLKDIIALYLDENKLSGQIPTALGQMTSMIDLRLRDNSFTGSIPTELGALSGLETLYLDTNSKIEGAIPSELSNLVKLNELHMYQMNLSGPLPPELGLLEGLIYLYLDTNQLTGSIPEEWGEMRDLEELFLTGNNLSGWLPITLRGLKSLQTLRAADNELSGPIPSDMGKMLKLEYVYLEGNNFSGEVPSQLGELTKLKLMHLHDSKLSGEIPTEICKLTKDFVLRDLTADCGEIVCTCCTCAS